MNEEDSEQMGLYLGEIGFKPTENMRQAHVILLNTCSVRQKPEDKAFSLLGQIAHIKKARPEIVVGVCGCMTQLRGDEIRARAPFVDFVLGTAQIAQLAGLVEEVLQKRRFQLRLELPERKGAVVTDVPRRNVERVGKLKAFVPIQYGCDKFCSFCIVPTTRGRERSRPTVEIVQEVERLAELGTKEISLLGQTVNSYGKNLEEGKVPFAKLLEQVAAVPGIERIRFTSPYPRDFRTDLIEVVRDVPEVMEHCHMPLQSGDDDLLRSMKRLYTRESFGKIVSEMREKMPNMMLMTDLIVGFPGETEEQFQRTLEAVEEYQFYSSYMFIYSPRPGTPAVTEEQLPYALKQARLDRLIDLQKRITEDFTKSFVGRTFEVLVEAVLPNGDLKGYSREYIQFQFPGDRDLVGQIVQVVATTGQRWGCRGELA
jgi:tRNA-2-methylthio-N6-dimethylallyladenosine synthase